MIQVTPPFTVAIAACFGLARLPRYSVKMARRDDDVADQFFVRLPRVFYCLEAAAGAGRCCHRRSARAMRLSSPAVRPALIVSAIALTPHFACYHITTTFALICAKEVRRYRGQFEMHMAACRSATAGNMVCPAMPSSITAAALSRAELS